MMLHGYLLCSTVKRRKWDVKQLGSVDRNYNLNKTNNLIQIMLAWRGISLNHVSSTGLLLKHPRNCIRLSVFLLRGPVEKIHIKRIKPPRSKLFFFLGPFISMHLFFSDFGLFAHRFIFTSIHFLVICHQPLSLHENFSKIFTLHLDIYVWIISLCSHNSFEK